MNIDGRLSVPVIEDPDALVAICAVDGGTTTGVARGIFPRYAESAWEGLAAGKWESYEVTGEIGYQCWEIMGEFADWTDWPEHKKFNEQGVKSWHLVFEDFVVRLGTGASSKRVLLDPVRVASGCDTLCIKRDGLRWAFPEYQQSNLAKNYATNARLRAHGMWVVGSDHRRDAVRHLCRRYATLLGNN